MRTRQPARPSLELDDYSGPFQPDLHVSDFSKEGLMKLVEVGGSLTDERVDHAGDPGEYVAEHGLQRDTDAEIVNHEAGKYARRGR